MRFAVVVHPISDTILRLYKLAPLVVPHYDIHSAGKA
ncbi:MAG: cytochrome P450 [Candidatus Omnitrophica bacterium]|nr:cytochrome P450 [Candidatus Omnitrophota bacterium]MBU4478893.1 cytochrome P450 [Candidatus Omnitrophota bacterium]MCG2702953.1 cytochrome P450 [Candidatus Omnitrophota bacterium]